MQPWSPVGRAAPPPPLLSPDGAFRRGGGPPPPGKRREGARVPARGGPCPPTSSLGMGLVGGQGRPPYWEQDERAPGYASGSAHVRSRATSRRKCVIAAASGRISPGISASSFGARRPPSRGRGAPWPN